MQCKAYHYTCIVHYSSYGILYWTLLSVHVGVMSVSSEEYSVVFDWSNISEQLINQSELVNQN